MDNLRLRLQSAIGGGISGVSLTVLIAMIWEKSEKGQLNNVGLELAIGSIVGLIIGIVIIINAYWLPEEPSEEQKEKYEQLI